MAFVDPNLGKSVWDMEEFKKHLVALAIVFLYLLIHKIASVVARKRKSKIHQLEKEDPLLTVTLQDAGVSKEIDIQRVSGAVHQCKTDECTECDGNSSKINVYNVCNANIFNCIQD